MTFMQTTPRATAEGDVRARFIRAYETNRPKAIEGEEVPNAVSKSYYYDSKALEGFDEDLMEEALSNDVPRATLIEISRLEHPEDRRAMLDEVVVADLSCRDVRMMVRLLKQVRFARGHVSSEFIGAVGLFLAKHPMVQCPELRRVLPTEAQQAS